MVIKTLITPAQVIALAFAEGGYTPPEIIHDADIAAAEVRHIIPVVGAALYQKLLEGAYADFTSAYIAPALALFTRAAIQPRIDISCSAGGSVVPRSSAYQAAGDRAIRELGCALRKQAQTHLRRATELLDSHRDEFVEYDPVTNILKRCSIDGGFVQVP